MSKEEIEDIELAKEFIKNQDINVSYDTEIDMLKAFVNLIEKQQKEIEELKEPKYLLNAETGELKVLNNDFISKDKIREKIKEARKIRWHIPKLVIEYFEELLEEK